ncbi:fluoride efflux transporter FluC [Oceanobacillus damuensis]|uniref:fluoride efflux transporter FluC n=1 Tax=Oceanobacillus damuensis TaxID=937928 RepID=UPI00082BCA16|nr:CrcB family protein [Oceanobacillus damuensis]
MKPFLAIGFGGMLGSGARYGVSLLLDTNGFPLSTLIVNLIGCFMLAYLLNNTFIKQRLKANTFIALTTGLIGSFTTFSALAVESVQLWETSTIASFGYIIITLVGGLVFCYLGFQLAQRTRKQVAK